MRSTREAYGDTLVTLGENHDFYVMDADLSKATQTVHFAKKYPERFFNMGIAEGNMMGFAAGFSTLGKPVFASSFAEFASGRAFEQVRNTIAYSQCNVKIAATHAGLAVGADGGSHQCIEDIALMRVIPNMTVLCPCDYVSAAEYVKLALAYEGPVYLRLGRSGSPEVYTEGKIFSIGKGTIVKEGNQVTIFAVGDMVARALDVAKEMEGVSVVDLASIKPLDRELVIDCAKKTGAVVTAEDHSVIGGLGSAVAELLSTEHPTPIEMVGVKDVFGSSGSPAELAKEYGIDQVALAAAVKKVLERKKASCLL